MKEKAETPEAHERFVFRSRKITERSPDAAQDGQKMAPEGPKIAQDKPKMAQDGPKMGPRWPKTAQRANVNKYTTSLLKSQLWGSQGCPEAGKLGSYRGLDGISMVS